MTDEERFQEWLRVDNPQPFRWDTGLEKHILICVPKREGFDYLYHQSSFSDDALLRTGRFERAGILCHKDHLIYDADLDVEELSPYSVFRKGLDWMAKDLTRRVCSIIDDEVDNDRGNLEVVEITSPELLEKLRVGREHYAVEKARKLFLYSQPADPSFHCEFECAQWGGRRPAHLYRRP